MLPTDPHKKPLAAPRPAPDRTGMREALAPAAPVAVAPAPAARLPAAGSASMGGLVQALRRRWFMAVGLAGLAAILTALAAAVVFPARYEVSARVKLASRAPAPMFGPVEHDADPAVWKANQIGIVKSPLVLNAALNSDRVKSLGTAETVTSLENALKADFTLGPEIMRVTLAGNNPEEVAALLNAVIDAYLEAIDQQDGGRKREVLSQLDDKQKKLEKKLFDKRFDLHDREKSAGILRLKIDTENAKLRFDNALKKRDDLESDLDAKKREVGTLEIRLKSAGTEAVPASEVDRELRANPQLSVFYKKFDDNEQEIADVIDRTNPGAVRDQNLATPLKKRGDLLKQLQGARNLAETRLRAEAEDKLKRELDVMNRTVTGLVTKLDAKQDDLARLDKEYRELASRPIPLDIQKLRDDLGQLEKGLDKVTAQKVILEQEPRLTSRVQRLQNAEPPAARDYTRQLRLGGLGGLGMFCVVLFGVAYWESRSRKVGGLDDVTQGLGLTVVGTLPAIPPGARQPAAKPAPRDLYWQNRMSESVDAIRTQLLHAARNDGLQVVLVTSALGGEGKTSLASQLAASLARAWRKTLLIDGDLRNPAAHRLFDLPQEPGLSELLRGDAELPDVIKPTALSRLWVMPAGHWDAHAGQALAQDGVGMLFNQFKEQYDFIVVDSSPVLPVADTLLLGQHADAVLFAILRDVSRVPAVQAAQQRLAKLNIPTLGAVVIGAGDPGDLAYPYLKAVGS